MNAAHAAAKLVSAVSTRRQAEEGFSLVDQRERLISIAVGNGWNWALFEDAGISGETLDGRPAMQSVLAEVKTGQVDVLLVMDESRLSRDNYVGALIRNDLRAAGVRVVTPSGERDLSNPADELTAAVAQAAAAYEQRVRRQKSRAGRLRAAREGFWMGGPPPFGYKTVKDGHHLNSGSHR